jgi:hypothetical protein
LTYLRLAAVSLLVLCSQLTFADSIKTYFITSISMHLYPNDGSGDDLVFSFTGPHIQFSGLGGMECTDCFTDPIYGTPGFSASFGDIVFFTSFVINGVAYSSDSVGFNGLGLFNGFGGVSPLVSGFVSEGDTFFEFNLRLPTNGGWNPSYGYKPPSGDQPGYYFFTGADFEASAATPEPGTVALTLTGLAGIAGVVRNKRLRG